MMSTTRPKTWEPKFIITMVTVKAAKTSSIFERVGAEGKVLRKRHDLRAEAGANASARD